MSLQFRFFTQQVMAKKKKSAPSKPSQTSAWKLTRRRAIQGAVALAVSGFAVVSLQAYDTNHRTLHDLSVIGNGTPVVVQIHDPSCPKCRRLKGATTTALEDIDGINYRLADITTKEGKAIQDRYQVPHVTLLYFDGKGRLQHTTNGTLSADIIGDTMRSVFNK